MPAKKSPQRQAPKRTRTGVRNPTTKTRSVGVATASSPPASVPGIRRIGNGSWPPRTEQDRTPSPTAGIWTEQVARLYRDAIQPLIEERNRRVEKEERRFAAAGHSFLTEPEEWMRMQITQLEAHVGETHRTVWEVLYKCGQDGTQEAIQEVYERVIKPTIRGRFHFVEQGFRMRLAAAGMTDRKGHMAAAWEMLEQAKKRVESESRYMGAPPQLEIEYNDRSDSSGLGDKLPSDQTPAEIASTTAVAQSETSRAGENGAAPEICDVLVAASLRRAQSVATLLRELSVIKPAIVDQSDYKRQRLAHPDMLTFTIAKQHPHIVQKIIYDEFSRGHIRLAHELASLYHGRTISTIRTDWKDHMPPEFRRRPKRRLTT